MPVDATTEHVQRWFEDYWNVTLEPAKARDLLGAHGIDGDDAFELMEDFGARFRVDLSGYWQSWFFHNRDEPALLSPVTWGKAHRYVRHIPIDFDTLVLAAETGSWPIAYPEEERAAAIALSCRRARILNLAALGLALIVLGGLGLYGLAGSGLTCLGC